jgi:fibronectin-binding autotransporter adhesin
MSSGRRAGAAFAVAALCVSLLAGSLPAQVTWRNLGSDFNATANWTGSPANNTGVFNVAKSVDPILSANISMVGLNFSTSASSGYTISSSGAFTLTLTSTASGASSAINAANTSGLNTISAALQLSGTNNKSHYFTVAAGGTLALTGPIGATNDNTLVKDGLGTLILSGANTFAGAIQVTGGVLNIRNGAALGGTAAQTIVTTGAALELQGGITVAGEPLTLQSTGISGAGGLRNISGDNAWNGVIGLGSASTIASDSGTLTLGSGGINNGGYNVTFSGASNIAANGVITGAGGLIKNGAGTLTLAVANSYSGVTTINAGTVSVVANALGSGALTINAGTLEIATGFSSSRSITLGNAASTIQVNPGQTLAVTSAIGGTGSLTKTGTGTLTLSGANTYSGNTVVKSGVLRISADNNLGAAPTSVVAGKLVLDDGTLANTGTFTLSSNRGISLGAGGGTFETAGATLTYGGIIAGSGSLTKTGSEILVLSGANTYTGATNINAGTLRQGAANVISSSSAVTVAGGAGVRYDLNGFNATIGSLAGAGEVTSMAFGGTQTLTTGANNTSTTFSGTLNNGSGDGVALTKTGTGTLTLSGSNSYSGTTTINAGALNVQHRNGLGTTVGGTIVASGAALELQGGIAVGAEALTLNGSGVANDGALRNISGTNSFGGAVTLASASTIASDSGTLTLSGTIANAGFATTFAGAGNIVANGHISGSGGLVNNSSGAVTLGATNTYTGSTAVNGGVLQVNTNGALGTIASGTTVASGAALRLNNVNYSTAETLTLNGSGISNGGALVNVGTSTYAGQIVAATHATVNTGGGTLNLTGGLVKDGTTLTLTGGGTINVSNTGISGSSPNSDLVVDGTTVVLSAASTYNGPTTVQNSGTLQLGASNVLPTAPQTAMTVNTSSFFDLASYSDGVASLAGDSSGTVRNSVAASTSTLTVNPAAGVSTTFAGVIAGTNGGAQGNVNLVKSGSGSLTLTGANTYSGTTTVSGGTLVVANSSGAALASTSSITVDSGGTLMLGASNQVNNSAPVSLGGGTIAKGNFGEGSTTTAGFGALTLTATGSKLDFGSGPVGALVFANFIPDTFKLTIDNWTGTADVQGSASTDRLIFQTSLSSATLASFSFTGYTTGATQFNLGNGYYEITPTVTAVPEPSTYAAAALALLAIGYQQRRRLRMLCNLRSTPDRR